MAREKLSDELLRYGYVFSLKRTLLLYALTAIGMLLLGRFFGLHTPEQIALCMGTFLFLPFFVRNSLKNKYQQRRFSDINVYMEQFLYSFQKTGKVLTTLQEVKQLFGSGDMYDTITKAEEHILHTYDEKTVEQGGLSLIEAAYPYTGLVTMHRFALQVEKNGGDYRKPIALLLEARRLWADRVYMLLKAKKKQRAEIVLSVGMSLILCSAIYYMARRMDIDVASHPVAQIGTLIVLLTDIWILYLADKRFTADYINRGQDADTKKLMASYHFLKDETKKGILNRLGRLAAKRSVGRAVEIAFPQWLMQVSLLLQSENVQVAVFKSYDDAPEILKPALSELIFELQKNPTQLKPYQDFLSEFALPEVRSAMKMLYSLSEGTGGEAGAQIEDIIHRNQVLLDRSEKMKNEDTLAGMYALFLAPQITGGCKLVVDMVLLMVVYLSNMGGMAAGG